MTDDEIHINIEDDNEETTVELEDEDDEQEDKTAEKPIKGESQDDKGDTQETTYIVDDLSHDTEEKRERRRAEKKQKRQAQKEQRAKLEAKVKALTQQTIDMQRRLQQTEGNQIGFRLEGIKTRKEEYENLYQQATNKLAEFSASNNIAGALEAAKLQMRLKREYDDLVEQEKQVSQVASRPAPLDNHTVTHFRGWVDRNKEWYKTDLSNRPSRIADEISRDLLNDGFVTSQPEYWEELDRRCAEEIPAKAKTLKRAVREPVYDDDDDEPPQIVSGRGSGTRNESGRQEVKIPSDTVQQWKNAGIWDDPKERHKAIRVYQQIMEKEGRNG